MIVGRRIVVTGMAGAGKTTFSQTLSSKTGFPHICLDLYSWYPGWVRVPEDELHAQQRVLLGGEKWIVDSNDVAFDLLFERADTLVVLDTPWWICAQRAFVRGFRRPAGFQPPEGCVDSAWRRLRDEWGLVWRIWQNRHTARELELATASRCRERMAVHILTSTNAAKVFLERVIFDPSQDSSEGQVAG